jgi:antitoxin component YwqK of YwqJK toxin-antitoxin module
VIRIISFAILLFSSIPNIVKGQVITVVTDSTVVGTSVHYHGDTTYWIKTKPESGKYLIYFDTLKKQLALSANYYSASRYDMYAWYRNGQQRKIELNVDSLPYYIKNAEEWNSDGQHIRSLKYSRDSCIYYNWFPNGQLALENKISYEIPWNENSSTGESRWYGGAGVLYKLDRFYKDSTVQQYVYPDQKIWRQSVFYPDTSAGKTMRSDELEGYRISYYENGGVISRIYPYKGRQPVVYYYESGARKEEGEWQNGRTGKHTEYYESGKIKAEGEYTESDLHFADPRFVNHYEIKSGHWIYYSERERSLGKNGMKVNL